MRTLLTVIGLGVLVVSIAFAAGAPEADSSVSSEFVIGNGAAPQALDPHQISTPREHRIVMGLFEGLVVPDPETSRATPGLAERWEITEDGREYTFFLRDEAVWSDGTPVTAHDVVDSWMQVLNPRTAAPGAWFPALQTAFYLLNTERALTRSECPYGISGGDRSAAHGGNRGRRRGDSGVCPRSPHGRFRNERYTLRVAEAARMDSGEERFAALQEAERILIEEQTAVIPLYHYANRNLIDLSQWGGWYANVMGLHPVGELFAD